MRLPARERDRLGAFARADQAEAQVRLARLAQVRRAHQRPAEQEGHHRSQDREADREHHHVARHRHAEHLDPAGQAPEHADEGDEQERRVEQRMGEVDGVFGGDPDVLRDAPVGVVVVARDLRDLVVAGLRHPVAEDLARQPVPPGEVDAPARDHVEGIGQHRAADDDGKDADLHEEALHRAPFERVEEVRAPEIEPDRERHLRRAEQRHRRRPEARAPALRPAQPEGAGEAKEVAEEARRTGGRASRHAPRAPRSGPAGTFMRCTPVAAVPPDWPTASLAPMPLRDLDPWRRRDETLTPPRRRAMSCPPITPGGASA